METTAPASARRSNRTGNCSTQLRLQTLLGAGNSVEDFINAYSMGATR